jgi:hypothetical protein
VIPKLRYFNYDSEQPTQLKEQAVAAVKAATGKNLLAIEKAAKEAGVPCETAQETSDQPYEAIIEAAKKKNAISSSWLPTDGGVWRACCSAARLKKC